jgi:hypothetical protein
MTHSEISALLFLAERLLADINNASTKSKRDSSESGVVSGAEHRPSSNSTSDFNTYYLLHDAAMMAMRAVQALKSKASLNSSSNGNGSGVSSSAEDIQLELMTVKATWIVSKCWDALVDNGHDIGHEVHDSNPVDSACELSVSSAGPSACRLPLLVSGVTAGVRVIKSAGSGAIEYAGVRTQVAEMARTALALLEVHYHYRQPDYYEKNLITVGGSRSQPPGVTSGGRADIDSDSSGCGGRGRAPNSEYIEKVTAMCRSVLDLGLGIRK